MREAWHHSTPTWTGHTPVSKIQTKSEIKPDTAAGLSGMMAGLFYPLSWRIRLSSIVRRKLTYDSLLRVFVKFWAWYLHRNKQWKKRKPGCTEETVNWYDFPLMWFVLCVMSIFYMKVSKTNLIRKNLLCRWMMQQLSSSTCPALFRWRFFTCNIFRMNKKYVRAFVKNNLFSAIALNLQGRG